MVLVNSSSSVPWLFTDGVDVEMQHAFTSSYVHLSVTSFSNQCKNTTSIIWLQWHLCDILGNKLMYWRQEKKDLSHSNEAVLAWQLGQSTCKTLSLMHNVSESVVHGHSGSQELSLVTFIYTWFQHWGNTQSKGLQTINVKIPGHISMSMDHWFFGKL